MALIFSLALAVLAFSATVHSMSFRKADFLVHAPLPNVTFSLPPQYSGRLPVAHGSSDKLFFWHVQSEVADPDALVFWFNGGPGCSSMLGFLEENGPMRYDYKSFSFKPNPFSWHKLAHMVYVDQPLGVGLSRTSSKSRVADETEVGRDMYGFLNSFLDVFPEYASKNIYLTGESFAGVYIPYIAKEVLAQNARFKKLRQSHHARSLLYGTRHRPRDAAPTRLINLVGLGIGDGYMSTDDILFEMPLVPFIDETNLLKGHQKERDFFAKRSEQCNLTYPGYNYTSHTFTHPGVSVSPRRHSAGVIADRLKAWNPRFTSQPSTPSKLGCQLFNSAADYITKKINPCFNVYYIGDGPKSCQHPPFDFETAWLNDPEVRKSLHVADGEPWSACQDDILSNDSSPTSDTFLGSLANKIKVVFYSGGYDFLLNHFGTELTIQHLTWKGKRGFQSPIKAEFGSEFASNPSAPVGKVHRERGVTYVLIYQAGHEVPEYKPEASLTLLKDYILGSKPVPAS